MAEPNTTYSDEMFMGATSFGGPVNLPDACVSATNIEPGADIQASKLRHRYSISHSQKNGTDVVSETVLKHFAKADGDIVSFRVRPRMAPTGGDKKYTVDLQKAANGSNSWTTILSAVLTLDNTAISDTIVTDTLSTLIYSANDAFQIVITASGTTGSQGQGFDAILTIDEKAA